MPSRDQISKGIVLIVPTAFPISGNAKNDEAIAKSACSPEFDEYVWRISLITFDNQKFACANIFVI